MRFDLEFGQARSGGRRRPEASTRILVIGDLMGASAPSAPSIDVRPIVPIDVEHVEQVFARLMPSIGLPAFGVEAPLVIESVADIHPDRLVERIPVFDRLHDVRRRLQQTSTFRAAADELASAAPTPAAGPEPDTHAGSADTTFEQLLGGKAHPRPGSAATSAGLAPESGVDAFIRSLVAPHIVASPDPQLPQLLSAVDTALGDTMRAVLHDTALQRLEATWRAVLWLLSRAEGTDEHTVEIVLLHATAEELGMADTRDVLVRRLAPRGADASGWSLVVADVAIGPSAADLALLRGLAELAARIDTPLVAAAAGTLVGCHDMRPQADPKTWTAPPPEIDTLWAEARSKSEARFVGLTWPRFLLRLPYGAKTDPIEAFAFEEIPAAHAHDDYLWGNGAFAAALALARQSIGVPDEEAADIDDLPAFTYVDSGEAVLKPCAEIFMPERGIDAVLDRGVMPLVSYRHRNAARLIRMQSIAVTALG